MYCIEFIFVTSGISTYFKIVFAFAYGCRIFVKIMSGLYSEFSLQHTAIFL